MNKVLIFILGIVLIGIVSSGNFFEQKIEGNLSSTLSLPDQEVSVGENLEADFGEYSGIIENSFSTELEGVLCEIVNEIPEGLIIYSLGKDCVVEWDNPSMNQVGNHFLIVRASSEDVEEYYSFSIFVYNFVLGISPKWDLISFPVGLENTNLEEFFHKGNLLEVWSYENNQWKLYSDEIKILEEMVQGRGYWVRSTEPVEVTIGGELYTEGGGVMPLEGVELYEGWNLIGPYGTAAKTAYCSLFGLGGTDPQQTWTQLLKYDPAVNVQSLIGVPLDENLEPGRGYWILMSEDKIYLPSEFC